jgi:tRNA pseudouridine-54 N-methylase
MGQLHLMNDDQKTRLMQERLADYREMYRQERDNAIMLYRALARHAPNALKELLPALWQNTNELDKMSSEASREREKRQRLEWKLEDIIRSAGNTAELLHMVSDLSAENFTLRRQLEEAQSDLEIVKLTRDHGQPRE